MKIAVERGIGIVLQSDRRDQQIKPPQCTDETLSLMVSRSVAFPSDMYPTPR